MESHSGADATDSGASAPLWGEPEFIDPQAPEPGDIFDAEIIEDSPEPKKAISSGAVPPREPREPKTGPPNLDEWMDFFSRIVLRITCDWYLWWAFRGVDENLLTEREISRLQLTDDERQEIARPLAEMSNKSKIMRKHGRMIVASADSFYAFVILGAWASRVNRIASRYRPKKQRPNRERTGQSETAGAPAEANGYGTLGGHLAPGTTGFVSPGSG